MPKELVLLNPLAADLQRKLVNRTARTGVIGLGYVGLPLAVELGCAGFTVVGLDVDPLKCAAVNEGQSHVSYVSSERLEGLVGAGKLTAVTVAEASTIEALDTISICVPTPLNKMKEPDLSFVIAAADTAKVLLRPGALVVLESTTYPGTTEEILRGVLEETGLKAGEDFFLAYSPERVDPGLPGSVLRPRVVGGLTDACSLLAGELYGATAIESIATVSSPRAAEMAKILENTFRAVNIGLVNEMAVICEVLGIDIWEVVAAAATKPAGFMPFFPGPGLGGHCIPVDPFYLSWKVREFGLEAKFIELAGQVNTSMPRHVVDMVAEALNSHEKAVKNADILVLGVSYKPDVDDIRESPSLDVIELLAERGARVSYHDPFVPHILRLGTVEMSSVSCDEERLAAADCVVILTDHTALDYGMVAAAAKLIVDTRNAIGKSTTDVFKLGAPRSGTD